MAKYQFECKYEIEECRHCPLRQYDEFEELYCGITWKEPETWEKPNWCPLEEVIN